MLGRRAPGSRRNPRPTAITHVRPVVRSNCTAITHAKIARARGTRNTRSDSRPLCSYTTRPFALCAPLCLKQPRRRATASCVTSHFAPLAVRPPCPTLMSRCGRARCPHRAAPSRCHAPRCRPHNYPRALPCGAMVARRGSRLAPYRHHTCASRGAVPLRTAITPAKFARNVRVSSPRPVGNPKSPVAARHLFGCRTSRPAHVDFVDAIDEEAPRKEAIDKVSTESGTPQSRRETGFAMAFTPAKRHLLCRVIHLKNTFQKTGILVRLVRIFPG